MLQLKNINKRFGSKTVAQDINLNVEAGEIQFRFQLVLGQCKGVRHFLNSHFYIMKQQLVLTKLATLVFRRPELYAKSPQSVCMAAMAASEAVSVRNTRLPSVTD